MRAMKSASLACEYRHVHESTATSRAQWLTPHLWLFIFGHSDISAYWEQPWMPGTLPASWSALSHLQFL